LNHTFIILIVRSLIFIKVQIFAVIFILMILFSVLPYLTQAVNLIL